MFYVDQYVYSNQMRKIHPLEKFFFSIITMIIGLVVNNPVINVLIIILMLGVLIFWAKIPVFVVFKMVMIPAGFLVLGVITIAVTFANDTNEMVLFIPIGGYYLGFTVQSMFLALSTLLRSLSSVSCLFFLALTTPMLDIIYILQSFRTPAIITELMLLIYRFIFIFMETAFNIYTAQSSRWGYSNFRGSINSFGILFANLWGKSFMKSQELFISLLSRGYEKELKVINQKYSFSFGSFFIFVIIDIFILIAA